MKFTWKGLILAPLSVTFVYSIAFIILFSSASPVFAFLLFFAIGSFFSYCATVFLFLPCLYLTAKITPLTLRLTCALGTVLGGVAYIPLAWVMFRSSGDNSGPPQGTFGEYLWQQLFEPVAWAFPVGGLVTALVYWFLVNQPPERNHQPMK
jgi:hypothetical protein